MCEDPKPPDPRDPTSSTSVESVLTDDDREELDNAHERLEDEPD